MPLESTELAALALGTLRDTPLLAVIFRVDGAVAWVNPSVVEALDVAPEELEGHGSAVILRGDLPGLEGTTDRVEGDFELVHADGSSVWVRGRLSQIRDDAGRRLGSALVASATSAGASWHHRLLRSTLAATMGMMGAEVAHKVNNPSTWLRLNIDQMRADLTQRGSLDPELTGELLDECREGLERISEIVSELIDLASPQPDEIEDTDLREVVAAACSLAPLTPAGRVLVRRELSEVPHLQLASGRVGQAIWNLVSLCVRSLVSHDEHPAIGVRLHHNGVHVFLDLEVGMPLDLDPSIYQPGARTEGPPELRMARTVLAAHGGLVMPLPGGPGLRIQLPIVPPTMPL